MILASWDEGQLTIIFEAISQGSIVLSTKVDLISEMSRDYYPFHFEIENINSFKNCIKKFINYSNFRENIS